MKYVVEESCIGCGMCEGTCPNVFTLENGMAQAIESDVAEEDISSANEAMENCPVGAIRQA